MANTTSRGIIYPTSEDSIAPLETVFATLATTTDEALSKIQSGVTSTFSGPATVGSAITPTAITFPTAFATVPAVTANVAGTGSGVQGYTVVTYNVTGTSFAYKVYKVAGDSTGQTISIHWNAIGN